MENFLKKIGRISVLMSAISLAVLAASGSVVAMNADGEGSVRNGAPGLSPAQNQPTSNPSPSTNNTNENPKIAKIAVECENIKLHLGKVRSSDALKRVNLGQTFEYVSNSLMAKLNVAAVMEKLDAANLVEITAKFDKSFTKFKEDYQVYEKELVEVSKMDCSKNYSDFYAEIEKLRKLRESLNGSVADLSKTANEYLVAAKNFKAKVE